MALLQTWRDTAYSENMDKNTAQKFWGTYFELEKNFYAELLSNPDEEVKGTVKELAAKYNVEVFVMTGILDGINDSLKEANPIEEMEEDTTMGQHLHRRKEKRIIQRTKSFWYSS